MNRAVRRRAVLCLGTLALSACGEPGHGLARRPSLITEIQPNVEVGAQRARWVFHPTTGTKPKARLALEGSQELAVGEGGERWIEGADDVAEVAPFAAPEALVDVGRVAERYAFVGASGLVYFADEPLGPFVEVRRPPRSFISAAAHGGLLAGVERSGQLWIGSEWGASWRQAQTTEARFVDVLLGPGGTGLALAVPEAWWVTTDRGVSWHRADLPPVGARRLTRTPDGDLLVEGLFRRARYEAGEWVEPRSEAAPEPSAIRPGPVPDAARIREGSAVLDGGEYFALELQGKDRERVWTILSGPLGGRLQERPAGDLGATRCADVRVAKSGGQVAVLCGTRISGETSAPVTLWTSDDRGVTFQRRRLALRGVWSELKVAVGAQGDVVLSGVCPPHLTAAGCAPRGTYRLTRGEKDLEPLALPGLGTAEAIAVGHDERLYVVGPREKDQRLSLYASLDGGRSFRIRDLEVGDGGAGERSSGGQPSAPGLGIDEDGPVAVSVRTPQGWTQIALDAEGHVISRGTAPAATQVLAAVGLKALALDPARPSLWESVDGGSSWELVPLPRPLCPIRSPVNPDAEGPCGVEIACSAAGCLLGDSISRLGWGAEEVSPLTDPTIGADEAVREVPHRTPIACVLGGEPWQTLEGVNSVPGAPDAVLGRTSWFAAAADYETGAVWAFHAYANERSLRRRQLLEPLAEPTRHALAVLDQVEGTAALRYRVPHSSRGETEISGVEVAWDNRFHDLVGRGKIKGSFRPLPGDYRSHAPRTLMAEPALLSIAGRGVYLRLHPSLEDRQTTFYTEGSSVETLPAVAWPPHRDSSRTEMVRIDDRSVPIAFHGEGQWLAWAGTTSSGAGAQPGTWSFGASLVALPDPRAVGLAQSISITYSGLAPALAVVQANPGGTWWRAYTVPLRSDSHLFGSPAPAPLLTDLPDPPPPCEAVERSGSPRLIAPSFPGEPYPVLVTDAVDPPRLLRTGRAVLHGSPERPCVAAFEASTPHSDGRRVTSSLPSTSGGVDGRERTFALLPAADLGHSWLFREVTEARWQRTIHARPMSCRFDANAVIPSELSAPASH